MSGAIDIGIGLALKALIGAVLGSFVTTCAMRMAAGRRWAGGRSSCDHCQVELSYAATLPIMGYASAGGRCRRCSRAIDPLHPIGELAGAVILMTALGSAEEAVLRAALGLCLLFVSVFDLKTLRIPDLASLAVLLLGLALAARQGRLVAAVVTVFGVWAALTLLRATFLRVRGKDGMGGGDIKLLAACAGWVGPLAAPWVGLIAAALALLWLRVRHVEGGARLGFAPFIAVAAWSTAWAWSTL